MSFNFKGFEKLEEQLIREYEKLKKIIKKPNILLVGGTGVGKSSLVNLCFGRDIAEVGTGKPLTKCLKRYENPNVPIVLYDTKGYELGTAKHESFLNEVLNFVIENKTEKERQVHIIWYCIQAPGHRILDIDIGIIRKFQKIGIPVAIIFTKCDLITEDEMSIMEYEASKALPKLPCFKTTIREILNYLEIEKLCSWSIESLPDGLKIAFISAQRINLKVKKEKAKAIVLQHSSASAFVGFAPIPFSDAPILLSNQLGMLVRILFIYDMQTLILTIKGMIGTLGLPAIISNSGIWISGQLLKLIPGLGTVAGGFISASVAASITFAIGFSTIEFCHKMYALILEGDLEEVENYLNNAETIFENLFKENYNKGDK